MFRLSSGVATLSLAFCPIPAVSETIVSDPVVITTTRFADHEARIPASISVLSAEDIAQTPAINVPDILATTSGIAVTSFYGNEGLDAALDMRGFGEAGSSNALVLLDGQRLNTVDASSIPWATLPLQAIERIEIVRGAGSVLFGDRATGGVVNLVTRKDSQSQAGAQAAWGSYGYRALDGGFTAGGELGYFNTFVHASENSGWRQNSQSRQASLAGRGALNLRNDGAVFVDYAAYTSDYGLPGSIDSATYRSNPSRARTPHDTQQKEGYRLRPGIAWSLSDTLDMNAEFAVVGEDQNSDNVSFRSKLDRTVRTVSFTPRILWRHGLGSLRSETTAGFDYYHGRVTSESSTYAFQRAKQISKAFYLQNTTVLDRHWSVTLGERTQNMQQTAQQDAYPAFSMPAFAGASDRTRSIYDIGLHYQTDSWSLYGKTGTSFRFANTDELFAFDPFSGNPVFGGDIRPQHGRNNELGGYFHSGGLRGQAALFRTTVEDEIGYDGAKSANVNLDPTRHQGVELDLAWQMSAYWRSRLAYAYTDARFRSGAYAHKEIPLVSAHKATAQIGWDHPAFGNYYLQANFSDRRHVSGDYMNVRRELPGYMTLDMRAEWDARPFKVNLTGLNLLDKQYAPYGLYSDYRADYYYFPANGRTAFVSVKYDFR